MNRKFIFIVLAMILSNGRISAQTASADYHVIPLPRTINMTDRNPFILGSSTIIECSDKDERMMRNAEHLSSYIREQTGITVPVAAKAGKGCTAITLRIDKRMKPKEAYRLTIEGKKIEIVGGASDGVFYAIQTLRKSLPCMPTREINAAGVGNATKAVSATGAGSITGARSITGVGNATKAASATESASITGAGSATGEILMPSAIISDAPAFAYRGMMLDCARHFFPVSFVKEFIDMLALHNMNVLHWHLTDDQGWRIEIKKYPRLTQIGAVRSGTVIGANSDIDDSTQYKGYYTQEQIRDIVEYARDRYITVIPEIDMPGHTLAALAAYPEYGCTGGPYQVGHKWGIYQDVLCIGNDKMYRIMEDILDEIIGLFPSDYINIGGDETPTARWDNCPRCQSVKREGETLQGHFTRIIEKYLVTKGKKVIGWDELLGNNVSAEATIMSWRGSKPGIMAAEAGHDVVMSPITHCYFDYYQTENTNYEPSKTGMWPISVQKVYEFIPVPDTISATAQRHIIGVQANLWTEYVPNKYVAEYMVLPRMAALSEVQWTDKAQKDFGGFVKRLTRFTSIYDTYGWRYALHLWPERMVKDRWHH